MSSGRGARRPGATNVLHFNNAGSALMPQPVLDATVDYLKLEAPIGGYEAADREDAAIERFYDAAASMLGCDRDEIAFIENATRAWDMAFYALPFAAGRPHPDRPRRVRQQRHRLSAGRRDAPARWSR